MPKDTGNKSNMSTTGLLLEPSVATQGTSDIRHLS